MAQRGACKHDPWQGYMTVHVINHGIIKSIRILTTVICPMINFDVDYPRDCLFQDEKWMLAISYQLSTLPAFALDRVHHLPHTLLLENDTDCQPEGNQ
jgi:hypothetical protein